MLFICSEGYYVISDLCQVFIEQDIKGKCLLIRRVFVHFCSWTQGARFIQMTPELLMFDVLSDHGKYGLLIGR